MSNREEVVKSLPPLTIGAGPTIQVIAPSRGSASEAVGRNSHVVHQGIRHDMLKPAGGVFDARSEHTSNNTELPSVFDKTSLGFSGSSSVTSSMVLPAEQQASFVWQKEKPSQTSSCASDS
jgi:hypothetical protein